MFCRAGSIRHARRACGIALALAATLAVAADPVSSSVDPPVAYIDGKPVLASELVAASQGQVLNLRKQEYEIKRRALDAVLDQKLLESEAAQRATTVEQMLKDLEAKVTDPSDAEIEAFFLGRQESGRRFEDVREQMRSQLKTARRTAARDAFIGGLRKRHTVEVAFDSPRIDIVADPARLKGAPDAPVQIVEFSDFECPFCRRAESTIQAVVAKYQGKVSLAYRDFPLTAIHASAQQAAEASRCAAEQGKFWTYHERLFASDALDVKTLKTYARDVGLDTKRFDTCLETRRQREAVDRDAQQGRLAGVTGTPAFFINGIPLSGAQPAAAFEKIIDEELARKARQRTASR
jgi:predicted DsbA family dithiol-disulfide isomerase